MTADTSDDQDAVHLHYAGLTFSLPATQATILHDRIKAIVESGRTEMLGFYDEQGIEGGIAFMVGPGVPIAFRFPPQHSA
ncbi:hypothetical protein ACWIGW_01225 [Nocardia brasiliensis]